MKVLVFNSGSSTLKFQLIEISPGKSDRGNDRKLAHGVIDRIGGASSYRCQVTGSAAEENTFAAQNHEEAVVKVIEWLAAHPELPAFDAVGHRVVHGGDRFASSVLVDDRVIASLDQLTDLAPLHNPGSVSGIRAARKALGIKIPMVAVFDTSFHHTIPEQASTYAIPHELSSKHGIRRYGFHGLAHQYDLLRYHELTGTPIERINIVTLHLGNGCSATAVKGGKSVDTSMGFTPLEGLVMGTRSGDLDPALVSYLARKESVDSAEIERWLNTRSGLLGISGLSNDMRELTAAYEENPRVRLAVDVFCYRARKYLGAYLAVLNGAEAVVFSGGIGENSSLVREQICRDMEWCGLKLDAAANASAIGKDRSIAAVDSNIEAFVIHSDEEWIIARETVGLVMEPRHLNH
ncbi:MAG: acetate/propionate family kinase [Candidatus Binatia bacterium]